MQALLQTARPIPRSWLLTRAFSTTRRASGSQTKPPYFEGHPVGTIRPHRCSVFLHASEPPSAFHKAGPSTSISRELQLRVKQWGALSTNFIWREDFASEDLLGRQPMTVYSQHGRLDISDVSLGNIEEVEHQVREFLDGQTLAIETASHLKFNGNGLELVDVYVCTHGARDCRCGERGQQMYDALLQAVEGEKVRDPGGTAQRIRIGATGHVGGHQYAANVLIFPHGEWLGCMQPEDAPWLVSHLCLDLKSRVKALGYMDKPLSIEHWRGRMGLSKEEMMALYRQFTVTAPAS